MFEYIYVPTTQRRLKPSFTVLIFSAQEIFDDHLAAMDAVKISTPKADSFRLPHVARLAKTPKVNPVHAAAVQTPPVHVPASEDTGGYGVA